MTEKELKKLNRYQLLELIIMQTEELEKVKTQLADAEEKLQQRSIQLSEAGNIANAALQLSGIFEAAQAAADLYLENVKSQFGHVQNSTDDGTSAGFAGDDIPDGCSADSPQSCNTDAE